jgi:amidase
MALFVGPSSFVFIKHMTKSLRPLHGLPMLLKNNIATQDQMNTTYGSWGLLGAKVPRDSTVVTKLRAAGAIILGKANLSQWGNFRSDNSNQGWAAVGGQVLGAYSQLQDPSGSSSGSAVASSIGLAFASIGTETDGSLISPASVNNVVAIKPSMLWSESCLFPANV